MAVMCIVNKVLYLLDKCVLDGIKVFVLIYIHDVYEIRSVIYSDIKSADTLF